jgi:dienelactone hydrolase
VRDENDFEVDKAEVAFQSPGAGLRGVLLEPRNGEQILPAIVMAPGMSGVKEGLILQYAKYLARGGFAVLAYDNISFGASGGEPRQEVDPQQRRRGYRDAIAYIGLGKSSDLPAVLRDIVEQLGGGMVTARGDRT